MKTLIDLITEQVTNAFTGQGYDAKYGKVTLSNRPDLCEYQCNGAMAAAKEYKCAPFMISDKIAQALAENELFESVESVKPGFINMKVSPAYLAKYVSDMKADEGRFGCDKAAHPKTIIVDYGGANVAKPLHVGHLRSAVIGESIKRIGKFMGHHMIGDVHLGDWGLQMGLIIVELKERKPDLVYYDESYTGEYPKDAPFTISELEDIYPTASKKSKEDEAFREAAMEATSQLQAGRRGYRALLAHILDVSVTDLKKNYDNLNVSFELWKGESDAQPYIPDMVQMMKDKGFACGCQRGYGYKRDSAMYHFKVRRSFLIQYDRSCYDCDAYAGLQPGCHHLPDGSASEHAFRTGIPLCKKDRTRRTGCGTDPYRIRYHERKRRQTV